MGNGNTAGNRLDADTSKDVTLISWDIGTSTVKFRFSRKFDTKDAKDKALEKGKNYGWAYAWSNSDSNLLIYSSAGAAHRGEEIQCRPDRRR